jgi:hypothetical protein
MTDFRIVFDEVVHRITNGVLLSLLSSLKSRNSEMQASETISHSVSTKYVDELLVQGKLHLWPSASRFYYESIWLKITIAWQRLVEVYLSMGLQPLWT